MLFSGYSHAKSACFSPEKHGILIPAMMKQEFLSKTLAKCKKSKWNILRLTATANKVLFISSHLKTLSMKWYKTQQFRILLSSKLSPWFITNMDTSMRLYRKLYKSTLKGMILVVPTKPKMTIMIAVITFWMSLRPSLSSWIAMMSNTELPWSPLYQMLGVVQN